MAKEYKKLNKYEEYDHETVEELAEAMNELRTLERRANVLKELIGENQELSPFVWTTAEGVSMALHDIADDHFKNILTHINNRMREIPKSLKAEANRRGFELPDSRKSTVLELYATHEAFDDEDLIPDF
jgi:hypothetical protein